MTTEGVTPKPGGVTVHRCAERHSTSQGWGSSVHTGLGGIGSTHKTRCVHSAQGSRKRRTQKGSVDLPTCRPPGDLHHGTCQGVGWGAG